ncbi:conserved hypothetical protein [Burkholderia pseudomallei 576]|nr:conserved hypothetical protein [Burkholderia pseudomallei 576]
MRAALDATGRSGKSPTTAPLAHVVISHTVGTRLNIKCARRMDGFDRLIHPCLT